MVIAANPVIETMGQIAAIVICLFVFVFVLLAVAFNLAIAFGMGWVREKMNLIKMLRPNVESVNHTTEAALQGVPPTGSGNAIARTAAKIPTGMQTIDKKVDDSAERVTNAVIEFRARSIQARTVVKAFLAPGSTKQVATPLVDKQGLQFKSPGYRMLIEEKSLELSNDGTETGIRPDNSVTASSLKNASTH